MVAVTTHHPLQHAQIVWAGVEKPVLIHHQKTQPISGFEQLAGRCIVRGANGVAAQRLQTSQPKLDNRIWKRYADAGVILVDADALDLHRLIVEKKAAVGVEPLGSKSAERHRLV